LPVSEHVPAPDPLAQECCLDFINSRAANHRTGEMQDDLGSPRWQEKFLRRHDLELATGVGAPPLAQLARARADLRDLIERWAAGEPVTRADIDRLDRLVAAPGARRARAGDGTPRIVFEPRRRDWRWVLSEVAVSTVRMLGSGEPARLKVCGNPACTWLFYDQSHNASRRWCDVTLCGNLVKVREFRARRRAAAPA
jgi:predicted RNA-binding Zn ribbon-like protein